MNLRGTWATAHDLADDVLLELSTRRARTVLMLVAVALSTGALLASVNISATASRQIGSDLAASTLDVITVTAAPGTAPTQPVFPDDAAARATSLRLVDSAGLRLDVVSGALGSVRRVPQAPAANVKIVGVTSGYLRAADARTRAGHDDLLDGVLPVAVVGQRAAHTLGLPDTPNPTGLTIAIGGQPYDVVDQLTTTGHPDLSDAVLLPYDRVAAATGSDGQTQMLVRVQPGAGSPVAHALSTAIRPDAPQQLDVSQVLTLESLRRGVDTQLGRLAGGIGLFLLVLTCLLIANSMIVSVIARTAEIGLRRALGTSRHGVSAVIWCEGSMLGAIGGATGGTLSLVITTALAAVNHWSAVLVPWTIVAGPVIGALVGLLASAYPAVRAARISPAVAVRAD